MNQQQKSRQPLKLLRIHVKMGLKKVIVNMPKNVKKLLSLH